MATPLVESLQAALGEAYRIERELGAGGMSRPAWPRGDSADVKELFTFTMALLGVKVRLRRRMPR